MGDGLSLLERHHRSTLYLSVAACTFYTLVLLVRPDAWCPESILNWWQTPRLFVTRGVEVVLTHIGSSSPSLEARYALYYFVTAGLVPWGVLALLGRARTTSFGLRWPNRFGVRVLLVGTVVSVPCLWWMINQSGVAEAYVAGLDRVGYVSALTVYLTVLCAEHFFFHGAVLAVCRVGCRWPEAPPLDDDATTRRRRVLQWFGMAQSTRGASGLQKTTRWLGLPDGCTAAVICSGVLFASVHLGKNPRELVLSMPGGLASAYLAYRTNSLLVPAALHFTVGAVATVLVHLR